MNKKWSFDEKFFKEKIKEGKSTLKQINKDSIEAENIIDMIDTFEELLGKEKREQNEKVHINKIIKDLNVVINEDLQKVKIDEWRELKRFCKYMPKIHLNNINNSELPMDSRCVLNEALRFYHSIDLKVYAACKKIINSDYSLINLSSKKKIKRVGGSSDFVYMCEYLNLPFINISYGGDLRYVVTVHELRHAANYVLYGDKASTLLGELPSIYSELLFTDKLNLNYDCTNLYNLRINNVSKTMKNIVGYINILERFVRHGRELTKNNLVDVLDVSNYRQLLKLYKIILESPYLNGYDYIVSTLVALSYRDSYYNGFNNRINRNLERILKGDKLKLNYDKLSDKYIDHINYVYSLSKK